MRAPFVATVVFSIATLLPMVIAFSSNLAEKPRFVLKVEESTLLTRGSLTLPPMMSVPCSFQGTDYAGINQLIQPPSIEELYDWYVQVQNQPDGDPSWACVWPTACTLATYLVENPSLVQDKKIIELGCGVGLSGLTAASLGASSVTLTDREPWALHCSMSTAAIHTDLTNVVKAAVLDWSDDEMAKTLVPVDVILASDVLYDTASIEAFANICHRLAHNPTTSDGASHTRVLVTDPRLERTRGARDALRRALGGRDFGVEDLPLACNGSPDEGSMATTAEGRDHERRMREPTVLVSCTL